MLDLSMPEDIILRITTLLANLATVAKKMNIDPIYDLPPENKAAAPDTMYVIVYLNPSISMHIFLLKIWYRLF